MRGHPGHRFEGACGALQLGEGQGAIDGDHGRAGERHESVIELHDLGPVGLTRTVTMDMRRLQCGFELIPANVPRVVARRSSVSASSIIGQSHLDAS